MANQYQHRTKTRCTLEERELAAAMRSRLDQGLLTDAERITFERDFNNDWWQTPAHQPQKEHGK